MSIQVIGGGLAGCEAAWQIARRGVPVDLYEMKPCLKTPAQHLDTMAELVCSNSLRSDRLSNAVGLLKAEMRMLDSLIMRAADENAVPAGGALAVDRVGFSAAVDKAVREHPLITVHEQEVTDIPTEGTVIIASGPLTSDALSEAISRMEGLDTLHFYDAAAPIVTADSLDMDKVFCMSRYDRGADYLNCPMNREEYLAFVHALQTAETVPVRGFEESAVFEGCMPIESMAKRGDMAVAFGPLKPVGLRDPRTGREPFAVVQLRRDNFSGTLYNLVGFQTRLTYPEQRRVFRMIPGLENAEFARLGVMHRNTFLNSPGFLDDTYRGDPRAAPGFRGTDHRCGGICGECGQRPPVWPERRAARDGQGTAALQRAHRHRRDGALCIHAQQALSAHELCLRSDRPAGGPARGKAHPQQAAAL